MRAESCVCLLPLPLPLPLPLLHNERSEQVRGPNLPNLESSRSGCLGAPKL